MKHKELWLKTRKRWLQKNPPNHQNYYVCHYCNKWVDASIITLDHIKSRSNRPDLRYDLNNLVPACYSCNMAKGSQKYEKFKNS